MSRDLDLITIDTDYDQGEATAITLAPRPLPLTPAWLTNTEPDPSTPFGALYADTYGHHQRQVWQGLPSYSSLQLRHWTWPALCVKAGVERRQVGRPPIHTGSQFLRRYPGAVPASVEEEIDLMKEHAEPPRPSSWPLFGIPTKTETFVVAVSDDTAIRCTRSYYSIR